MEDPKKKYFLRWMLDSAAACGAEELPTMEASMLRMYEVADVARRSGDTFTIILDSTDVD